MSRTERTVLAWLLFFLVVGTGVRIYKSRGKELEFKVISSPQQLSDWKEKFEENRKKQLEVDLNLASQQDLENLPEMGPELSKRILLYRKSVGRIKKVEEILNVRGFGKKRYERLRVYLLIDGKTGPPYSSLSKPK